MGTVLVASGLLALTYGLVQTDEHAWGATSTVMLLAGAAVLLGGFVAWERRVRDPLVELALFRDRAFSAGAVVYGVSYLALTGVFFFVTLYFQNVKGWSALETGLSWLPLNLPFLAVTPFAGRIVARFGSANVSGLGTLLGAVAVLWLAGLEAGSSYAAAWPAYVLIGLGYGLLVPAVSSAAMGAVPAAQSGVGAGVLNTARQVGAAVGLAVLGSIGHAAATEAWSERLTALPAGVRAEAATLGQQVAGAEGRTVGRALGPEATQPAFDAFAAGLQAGLVVAGVAMLLAVPLAVRWDSRAHQPRAGAVGRRARSHAVPPPEKSHERRARPRRHLRRARRRRVRPPGRRRDDGHDDRRAVRLARARDWIRPACSCRSASWTRRSSPLPGPSRPIGCRAGERGSDSRARRLSRLGDGVGLEQGGKPTRVHRAQLGEPGAHLAVRPAQDQRVPADGSERHGRGAECAKRCGRPRDDEGARPFAEQPRLEVLGPGRHRAEVDGRADAAGEAALRQRDAEAALGHVVRRMQHARTDGLAHRGVDRAQLAQVGRGQLALRRDAVELR